ncbi:DinB family protein [Kitasatospora sp. NBC_00070]|uniref:DinB family protein n=1 Tax=Kitasatospora sp. NBC_00070 TaxID=2975962 RepID=UPI003248EB0B
MSPRPAAVGTDTEREALVGFLDKQRASLLRKLDGLSDEDARRVPTASALSLLGLLKHSGIWERRWFQIILAGHEHPDEWPAVDEEEGADFALGDDDTVAAWRSFYETQVALNQDIVAGMSLETPCAWPKMAGRNLRWVMLHMIEETARHAGHADIIRETLDGETGI